MSKKKILLSITGVFIGLFLFWVTYLIITPPPPVADGRAAMQNFLDSEKMRELKEKGVNK